MFLQFWFLVHTFFIYFCFIHEYGQTGESKRGKSKLKDKRTKTKRCGRKFLWKKDWKIAALIIQPLSLKFLAVKLKTTSSMHIDSALRFSSEIEVFRGGFVLFPVRTIELVRLGMKTSKALPNYCILYINMFAK